MLLIEGRKYYTPSEMAGIVGASAQWVRLRIKEGRIKAFYDGGTWFIPASHVRRWRRVHGVLRLVEELRNSEAAVVR